MLSKTEYRRASSTRAGHFVGFVHLQLLAYRRPSVWKEWCLQPGQGAWIKKVFAPLIGDHCECSNGDKQAQAFNLPKFPTLPHSPHFTVRKTEAQKTVYAAIPFLAFWTGGRGRSQSATALPHSAWLTCVHSSGLSQRASLPGSRP